MDYAVVEASEVPDLASKSGTFVRIILCDICLAAIKRGDDRETVELGRYRAHFHAHCWALTSESDREKFLAHLRARFNR